MDLFDTLTFAEILGRTTFLGTLSLTVLFNNFQERKIAQTLNFFLQHFHHWDKKKLEIC
jgi:hypothetical protein